jgi:RND family efflux transporter MFP subunit
MRPTIRVLRLAIAAAMLWVPARLAAEDGLTVVQRPVADEKAVFGTVESISVVPARSRIGGTVAQLNVREGDRVTAGQAVASVGDEKLVLQMTSLDAQIEALQAQANQAQIDFTRTEGLVERGILPRIKLDEQRTALNVADNNLRSRTAERAVIKEQLNQGQVLAPTDGRVLKRLITIGSVVLAGDPVITVAQQNFK